MRISCQKLFLACAKAKMSKTQAINTAGLSTGILSAIKQGKNVNAATAGKLAAALGVPVEDLLEL
mgnify:CR=1 FL=1